jgi:hypothetical protein
MDLSKIGPFALEEKLGGPQSSVYRAIQVQQRKQVALKVFPVSFGANDHVRNEFNDEMALLKKLATYTAKCYGGRIEKQHAYLVLEIVDGETLAGVVQRRGRLAWEQAVDFAEEICEALQAAHELGVQHHDLTPDKILVTSDDHIKVVDFRRDRASNPFCLSSRKLTKDRLAFRAPEQLRGEPTGAQADLYSLGCLLFFMLTGRPPFDGDVEQIAQQQQTEAPPRVSSLMLDCPIWLDALVAQLLEKEPLKRHPSATAVLLALQETRRRAASGGGVTQHALGGISSLKVGVDKDEVRRLIGKPAKSRRGSDDDSPFYEHPWFGMSVMAVVLAICSSLLTWVLWPLPPDKMIAKAEELMASGEAVQQLEAEQSYLRPLVQKYPGTEFARRAQDQLDVLDMQRAESLMKRRQNLGKDPASEASRLYLEALKFEEFGDRETAQSKLQSMVDLMPAEGDDRLVVLLARRELARLKDQPVAGEERGKFIDEKLAEVDSLQKEGKVSEAKKILSGIVSLYGDNAEYATTVAQVRERLEDLGKEEE